MTELKTLKDIFEDWECHDGYIDNTNSEKKQIIETLRQEAIKWVKYLRFERKKAKDAKDEIVNFDINDRIALHDSVTRETYNIIQELFIREFFNLTEEDLKDGN